MRLAPLWTLAAIAGALGALVCFDAAPGINWPLWTITVVAGLLAYRRPDVAPARALALPLGFAVLLACAAAITTTELLVVVSVLIVASLLALAVVLAREPARAASYGAVRIVTAPFRAFGRTVEGALVALAATVRSSGSARAHPAVRGAILAAPVVLVFALLFATADPVFARGRDAIADALSTWTFLPRLIFGVVLTVFVAGAYTASLATSESEAGPRPPATTRLPRVGFTERRIVLGATAAISWLFVLLQLSYLFGNPPVAIGSGVTFADYARQGFGQLAVAATGAVLLIVAATPRPSDDASTSATRSVVITALVLLAGVVCILISAFHRVTLYEDAYGYTTARVYAQAYMLMTLVILAIVAWQVWRALDVQALARYVMAVALATLAAVTFWNADAWVARTNVDRFARTGSLDIAYLTRGLSPDAYPALVASLPHLPAGERSLLTDALQHEYSRRPLLHDDLRWFEWNVRRARARRALLALNVTPARPAP